MFYTALLPTGYEVSPPVDDLPSGYEVSPPVDDLPSGYEVSPPVDNLHCTITHWL